MPDRSLSTRNRQAGRTCSTLSSVSLLSTSHTCPVSWTSSSNRPRRIGSTLPTCSRRQRRCSMTSVLSGSRSRRTLLMSTMAMREGCSGSALWPRRRCRSCETAFCMRRSCYAMFKNTLARGRKWAGRCKVKTSSGSSGHSRHRGR